MKTLFKVNENTYIMPTYGIAILSEKADLDDEITVDISEKIIQNEKSFIEMKDSMFDFKPYKKAFNTSISMSLTNDCNMFCKYCYYSSGGQKNEHLSKSDIETIVQQLYKNAAISKLSGLSDVTVNVLVTGGGEPTLAWDKVEYLINALNKYKSTTNIDYFLHITTNGVFSQQKAHYLSENFHNIQISFDCIEDIQNAQRPMFDGSASYGHVKKTSIFLMKMALNM